MNIVLCKNQENARWDSYVVSTPDSSVYHLSKWRDVVEKSFGHKTFFLMAEDGCEVKGVLPLVLFSSKTFGRFMVSLPFFNYGGICADNKEAAVLLLREAVDIAKKEKAGHIELRHCGNNGLSLPVKETKVSMILGLKESPQDIWDKIGPKVRNQVRKAEKSGLKAEVNGKDGLDEFYKVFASNMRDLGTPVYGKNFFKNILDEFPENTKILTVSLGKKVIAASFVVGFKDVLEVPWAGSLKKYRKFCPVMLLYWKMIEHACLRGYKFFDFGRSTRDSGTYKFKEQWGAKPKQLYWHYWLNEGEKLPEINPHNPKYRLAVKIWQNTPLFITKMLGPGIVKNIP